METVLQHIHCPDDVKSLTVEQLVQLAQEIRTFILDSVSRTGGHLGSNLGAVEAILAMHYVFDFAKDKLLWDVGHQCYTHKIITGRRDTFSQLRHAGGPSGFPNPAESQYDRFAVGHAGTAIPTAIGMALAQPSNEQKIVAFVGDASIVNGVSFEGLNNLNMVKRQLLIVLNDNSMAIDPTVGAVAKFLSKTRLSQTYEDLVRTTNAILEHLPLIGKSVEQAIERFKKSIRMTLPASQLFESLNIPYFGPVDGHNIPALIELFQAMDHLNHPAILHIYTQKGKGFTPAEEHRSRMHSTAPFKINGEALEPAGGPKGRTFTDAVSDHLLELAKTDPDIVAITSAMADGTGLSAFQNAYPDRFHDVGIAESAAVDIAAGLANAGKKPVVCIYSTFLQRSFDQIFQEVALANMPVIFCIDRAGLVGADGPTHHGLMDIGYLRMMPNLVLCTVANEIEVRHALDFAIRSNRPVCIRYAREILPTGEQDDLFDVPFELGTGIAVIQHDKPALAIVCYGSIITEAIRAAGRLEQMRIEADVIHARFAAPIDTDMLDLLNLKSVKGMITVEDHGLACGFGSALLEAAATKPDTPPAKPIKPLGVNRTFVSHDSRQQQLMHCGICADSIIDTARQLINAR